MTILRDIAALAGFGAFLYGLYLWHPPLAWVAGGGIIVAIAYRLAQKDQ